jgi:predicted  nucleic acid-binding Zn-ribbon protein
MPGDILHCENFDRLSRADPEDSLKLFMEIIESGIILMVREQQYTRDIMKQERWRWQQVLSELIRAHEESLWKSERGRATNEGKREGARQHRKTFCGRRCPAWLRPIEKPEPGQWPLYELTEQAERYKQAWLMIDRGLGSPTIAAHFNSTHVPVLAKRTKAKPTQGWTAQLVRQLLRNPAAMGVYQPKKLRDGLRVIDHDCECIEGYYPPLVDSALFRRVDSALKDRGGRVGKGPHGQHYANLFKGLCRCGSNADHAVNIGYRSKEGLRYLRCDQSRHANCSNRASFRYDRLEQMVLDLSGVGMQDVFASLIPKPDADPRRHRVDELEATIAIKEEQVQAAWDRWLGPDAKASQTMRERAEQQIERIDAEITAYKAELGTLRQELSIIAAYDDDGFHERVREAREQLSSAQGEVRYAIRLRLAQELRRRIERIVLHPDGTMTVRLKEHQGLARVDVSLAADGVDMIDVIDEDDTVLTRFNRTSLVLLEPIRR